MQYNVAQLMKERTGATRKYALHEDINNLDPDLAPLEPIVGQVKLLRLADGVLVTGPLHTRVRVNCDRCLRDMPTEVAFELEDEFKPTLDILSGEPLQTEPEDEGNLIDAHHILDLSEVIRQRLWLNLPMHPLCREDCKGLCPNCGQDLNEGLCQCSQPAVDPRWAALLEFQRKEQQQA